MEIYHRDHWIIIVHMAIWKDLTKWNEENTIFHWINYMGRMVDLHFSCFCAFYAMDKLYVVSYLSHHTMGYRCVT